MGDICRPAEAIVVASVLDDRHRRLGGNPVHMPDHEMIEHEVAHDEDGRSGEPIDELLGPRALERGMLRRQGRRAVLRQRGA